jgi:hypothetical protein
MRIAVTHTMAPSKTICNTAREIGVAIYLARTSAMVQSSKTTGTPANGASNRHAIGLRMAEAAEPGHNTAHAATWAGTARPQCPGNAALSDRR